MYMNSRLMGKHILSIYYKNRLVSVKEPDGKTTRYEYDALGRRVRTDGVNEDTSYSYDAVGNLVSQTSTGAYELAISYAYDLAGRMTSESRSENGATLTSKFAYDALGQLVSFTRSDGQSESYAYDAAGNMLTKTQNGVKTAMSYNAANQLVQSVKGGETTTYSYDANGNLVKSENAAGARSYAYNALNLLATFTREDGYSESYTYNANRLLSSITNNTGTTTLTYDILYGDGVVLQSAQNGEKTSFVYGLERVSAISAKNRTEYVHDGRGSVAAELIYNGTSLTETITKTYSPFGEQFGEVTSGFGYNGEYYSAATGMIYLRARFYAPEMNRFSQKDQQIFVVNEYEYCHNNPILYVDINGMEAIVISGGDYDDRGETTDEKLSSYSFSSTGQREVELLVASGTDDVVTWIIADYGYSEADKNAFENMAKIISNDTTKVRVMYISNVDQLTEYINNGTTTDAGYNLTAVDRSTEKVAYVSVFSHGMNNEINLGFSYSSHDPDFDLTRERISEWDKGSFSASAEGVEVAPAAKLFACSTYKAGSDSIAVKFANTTGLDTYAYNDKSSYEYLASCYSKPSMWSVIFGSTQRAIEYCYWSMNPSAKAYWAGLKDGIHLSSIFQPIASPDRKTKTYKISPDGSAEFLPDGIPELTTKFMPSYLRPTPSVPKPMKEYRTELEESTAKLIRAVTSAAKTAASSVSSDASATKSSTTISSASAIMRQANLKQSFMMS